MLPDQHDTTTGAAVGPATVREAMAAMTTKETLEVQGAGHAAGIAGKPVGSCPHRGQAVVDLARQDQWLRGYSQARTELRAGRAQS